MRVNNGPDLGAHGQPPICHMCISAEQIKKQITWFNSSQQRILILQKVKRGSNQS